MSVAFFYRHFKFNWLATIFCSLVFFLLCSLGGWQLHRAKEKKQLLAVFQEYSHKKPLTILDVQENKTPSFHPVQLTGHYDSDHITLLIDNKFHDHQPGYHVLVPFLPQSSGRWVWVNRGWRPRGKSRDQWPKIRLPSRSLSLTGLIHQPDKPAIRLGENFEKGNSQSIWRAQYLDIGQASQLSKKSFYPFEVLLMSDDIKDDVLVRDWKPNIAISPSRHVGYAFQWFALAILFLVLLFYAGARRSR